MTPTLIELIVQAVYKAIYTNPMTEETELSAKQLIRTALASIPEMPQVDEPKWISVDEWLPDIGYESQHQYTSTIIILTDGKQVFTGYYERYRNIKAFCDVNGNHFKDRNIIVTHWQPLPAPLTSPPTKTE